MLGGFINKMYKSLMLVPNGCMYLHEETPTSLAVAGDWYPVLGTFADGSSEEFSLAAANGILTYNGKKPYDFFFWGTSNLKASKVCKITFGLTINDLVIEHAITPVNFTNANSYENIAIVRPCTINPGDKVRIYAKTDTENTDITVFSLNIVLASKGIQFK